MENDIVLALKLVQWKHNKNIAPTLYKKAIRKETTVEKALTQNKWVEHIAPVLSQ